MTDNPFAHLIGRGVTAIEALELLSAWSLPRWEPDNPQTEAEEMANTVHNVRKH